jgi:hypothetical protein
MLLGLQSEDSEVPSVSTPVRDESGVYDIPDDGTRWHDDVAEDAWREREATEGFERCVENVGSL